MSDKELKCSSMWHYIFFGYKFILTRKLEKHENLWRLFNDLFDLKESRDFPFETRTIFHLCGGRLKNENGKTQEQASSFYLIWHAMLSHFLIMMSCREIIFNFTHFPSLFFATDSWIRFSSNCRRKSIGIKPAQWHEFWSD